MAAGDVSLFDQFLVDLANGEHDMDADEFKLAFITDTVTPTTATAVPHFNGTGTTDLSANELTGGAISAGGVVIASTAITLVSTLAQFDGTDVSIAVNASNPTAVDYGIIYNNTNASKLCVAFLEFTANTTLVNGFTVTWNANGIARFDQT